MSRIKPLYNNIRLNCMITSDNHIDRKHPCPAVPVWFLGRSLSDAQTSLSPMDAYITVGDTTSRSSDENWILTEKCFAKYKPAKQIFLTVGNHDTWHDDGFESAIANYEKYASLICGWKYEKTYFSKEVNGYKFIFIGTSADTGCSAGLGEEELAWFEKEMTSADENNPVFVFCHQSLNGRHGLPRTWDRKEKPNRAPDEGGIGAESERVASILKMHKNVFYFSGHSHMGLCGENMKKKEGYASFETEDGVHLINLPSLACGNHHGEDNAMGVGIVLEVYDDRVVLRPRYTAVRKMNKNVMIADGKPYLEVIL